MGKSLFRAKYMTASGTVCPGGSSGKIGYFICTTGGTLVLTDGIAAGGATILASLTLAAKDRVELMLDCPNGAYATLGGGCVGTFGV